MPSVNPGPATTQTPNTVAELVPVNTPTNSAPVGSNGLRLLAVARGISLAQTGDVALMGIINAATWAPATIVTANGQVNGVAGSIATASIGIFTAAAGGGTAIKAQAALGSNSAAGSSIAAASATVILAFTAQTLYVNVGTALAGATVDVFVYGYDQT
jgi:hypothetical protein